MLFFYLLAFNMFNTITCDFFLFCGIFIFCAGFYFRFLFYTYIATLWILFFLILRFFIFFAVECLSNILPCDSLFFHYGTTFLYTIISHCQKKYKRTRTICRGFEPRTRLWRVQQVVLLYNLYVRLASNSCQKQNRHRRAVSVLFLAHPFKIDPQSKFF